MGGGPGPGAGAVNQVALAPAVKDDLGEVSELERACYSDPWAASAFEQLTDNPRVHFVLARRGEDGAGPILGYVVAWFVMDEGELANLAVTPAARRGGVAKALLGSVLAECERRGIRDLFLEVRESNAAALALYRGQGFEQVGRRESYYRHPSESALILRRRVDRGLMLDRA